MFISLIFSPLNSQTEERIGEEKKEKGRNNGKVWKKRMRDPGGVGKRSQTIALPSANIPIH
jgi:hypothetical protein